MERSGPEMEPDNRKGGPPYRFGLMEWGGAFGDFGTLIPFIAGYVGVMNMDPAGVLFAFGIAMVLSGMYYKTPFPVQPMKAIGAVAITQGAQTATITPETIYAAGLVTGLLWLSLGLTGAAAKLSRVVPRPVVTGIVLGLGFSLMLQGVEMMATQWPIAGAGLVGTLLLLKNRSIPAMVLLLLFGSLCGAMLHPGTLREITSASVGVRLPEFSLTHLSWSHLFVGAVFLSLPQLPLTFGNAVIAIREENNRLFPDHPVSERRIALSTGLMNIAGSAMGGVPMCHGAGGMAAHVTFGARTGGAPIILGAIFLILAAFFSDSVDALFRLLPEAILGVILFLTGAQLALGVGLGEDRRGHFITLVTAGFALWSMGAAFLVGMAGSKILQRKG